MAREPSYPDDVPVGNPVGQAKPDEPSAAAAESDEKTAESSRTRAIVTSAAIGIGSAALVAALLYANRSRRNGAARKPSRPPEPSD